jgi:hypothetical protein
VIRTGRLVPQTTPSAVTRATNMTTTMTTTTVPAPPPLGDDALALVPMFALLPSLLDCVGCVGLLLACVPPVLVLVLVADVGLGVGCCACG